jgi:hypothetical protein
MSNVNLNDRRNSLTGAAHGTIQHVSMERLSPHIAKRRWAKSDAAGLHELSRGGFVHILRHLDQVSFDSPA